MYIGYVRPVLEYCVPLFSASLTLKQINVIESIQKRACRIILGSNYTSYDMALKTLNLTSLETRRDKLTKDFALKLEVMFKSWFPSLKTNALNLRNINKYKEITCKTKRFQNSALPSLTRLLNRHYANPSL